MILGAWLPAVGNHVWQSMVFAWIVWLLARALPTNHARIRYWLWMTASLKFLIPCWLLISIGTHLGRTAAAPVANPEVRAAVDQIAQPFPETQFRAGTGSDSVRDSANLVEDFLLLAWAGGALLVAFAWWWRWRRIRAAVSAGSRLAIHAQIPIVTSPVRIEPGVFGILKPVFLLPEGITDRLKPKQLEVIVAHELCHVDGRDNLTALIHMAVEALFWFCPVVWWIGARLLEERERAWDEEVLRLGNDPVLYAESILKTCQHYFESRLVCVSGVTGSHLKNRIAGILKRGLAERLSVSRKLLLMASGIAAVAGPIIFGLLNPAQGFPKADSIASQPALSFEVASIRPSVIWKKAGEGRSRSTIEYSQNSLRMLNVNLSDCLEWAYAVKFYQIATPKSLGEERYDILAKDGSPVPVRGLRLMLRDLLETRFKLSLHRELKTVSVYQLTVSKGGPKLPRAKAVDNSVAAHSSESLPRVQDGSFVFQDTSVPEFAEKLSLLRGIDRPVIDPTGIDGIFDITLVSAADALLEPDGPSLFTLIEEQLGLKLVGAKAPVGVLVVDHA